MKDIFTFYRAVDPMKGSWDGYGCFPTGDADFLAFVTDAPSGASIHTPELIKDFWKTYTATHQAEDFPTVQLADALNRLQNDLQLKGRRENILYQATIAVARKRGSKLYYCCIGDSVLQIYRDETLYRLSESEVWDGTLIAEKGQSLQERQKTREIRFIGSNGAYIQIAEICNLDLKDQDLLLFYTDGVEDLLPPDRLLRIIGSDPQKLRHEIETIFSQDKVKDDATLLAIPARVPAVFQVEKEIASLGGQIEKLQKEQKDMRAQLIHNASTPGRLGKIEATLNQISQDVQRLNKPPRPGAHPSVVSAGRGAFTRKRQHTLWLIPLLCLLVGTAAGAFLFRNKKDQTPQKPQQQTTMKREVAPPEIPSADDCAYAIQKGDSLQKIATSRNITIEQLLQLNPSQKKDAPLQVGKTLMVCSEAP